MGSKQLTWDELTDREREFISGIVDTSAYGFKEKAGFIKAQIVEEKLQLTKPYKKSRINK